MKDKRFITAGKLIRTNEIKSFAEIIDVIPKTVIAKELGINPERFNRLIGNIGLFPVKDLNNLADAMEVTFMDVMRLIDHDLQKKKGRK